MDKINFQNLPNTTTPVNATNLNQLQTNVENAINAITTVTTESITPASGVTMSTYSYLRKNGKVVDFYYQFNGIAISADTVTTVGTLPEGFRPNKSFVCDAKFNYGYSSSGGTQYAALINIKNNGEIQFLSHNALTASHIVRIKTSYIMN